MHSSGNEIRRRDLDEGRLSMKMGGGDLEEGSVKTNRVESILIQNIPIA